MGPLDIALLAVALVLDAVAVAAAVGVAAPRVGAGDALRMGTVFGAFHVAMPAAGAALGASVGGLVQSVDHWIASALLVAVGGAMLRGALRGGGEGGGEGGEAVAVGATPFALRALLPLALATSIDALAVGVTLPLARAPMAPALAAFGLAAFAASAATVVAARRAGHALGPRSQRALGLAGAAALLLLAAKIPLEHLRDGI